MRPGFVDTGASAKQTKPVFRRHSSAGEEGYAEGANECPSCRVRNDACSGGRVQEGGCPAQHDQRRRTAGREVRVRKDGGHGDGQEAEEDQAGKDPVRTDAAQLASGLTRGDAEHDTWANPGLFDLDWSGGAPPEKIFKVDPFTEKWGQNWGLPLYRWDEMRRRGFDWWRTRIGNVRKCFHLYRIDYALGFFRIYSFPWTPDRNGEFEPLNEEQAAALTGGRLPGFKAFADDTPEHKAANQRQGEELLGLVLEASGDMAVVAEDLGVVPDYVPVALRKLGIPGFRIPSFFREPDGRYGDPAQYPRLSLCQPATHDHPPLAAAWAGHWQEIDAGVKVAENRLELGRVMEFAGLAGEEPPREYTGRLHEGNLRRMLRGNSSLVVLLITDLFAGTERFNTPGAVSESNWTTRMGRTVAELDQDPALLSKTTLFSRLIEETHRRPEDLPQ